MALWHKPDGILKLCRGILTKIVQNTKLFKKKKCMAFCEKYNRMPNFELKIVWHFDEKSTKCQNFCKKMYGILRKVFQSAKKHINVAFWWKFYKMPKCLTEKSMAFWQKLQQNAKISRAQMYGILTKIEQSATEQ